MNAISSNEKHVDIIKLASVPQLIEVMTCEKRIFPDFEELLDKVKYDGEAWN